MIKRDSLERALPHLADDLGVRAVGDPLVRAERDVDEFVITIALPVMRETTRLNVSVLQDASRVVDAVAEARDRLFALALEHIAKHDDDVRALVETRARDRRRRALERDLNPAVSR